MLDAAEGGFKALVPQVPDQMFGIIFQMEAPVGQAQQAGGMGQHAGEHARTAGGTGGSRAVAVPEQGALPGQRHQVGSADSRAVRLNHPAQVVGVQQDNIHKKLPFTGIP